MHQKPISRTEAWLRDLGNVIRAVQSDQKQLACDVKGLCEGQEKMMSYLRIINMKENFIMSRYTDMLANVTRMSDRVSGLKAVIQALADTPNDAQWKELNDKIIASADEVQAAIDAGAAPAPAPAPLPSAGGALPNE